MDENDKLDLDFVRKIRTQFIEAITNQKEGMKDVISDKLLSRNLLTALKDMDSAALTKLRIQAESDNADKDSKNQALIAGILARIVPSDFEIKQGAKNNNKKTLDDSDGTRDYVPGEMDIGVAPAIIESPEE